MLLQLLVGGVSTGFIYALIAMGYSLIYSASGLMNFAQGDLFMLGAFFAYTLFVSMRLPFMIAGVLVMAIMMVLGMCVERALISPVLKKGSSIHIVLITIGLSMFLQNFSMLAWGPQVFTFPSIFQVKPLKFFGANITGDSLFIVIFSIVSMILLHFFMTKTKLGTAMRAAAQDREASVTVGINVPLTIGITWGLASLFAAIAGILLAPSYGVYARMGTTVGLKGFAAAVVGGYGNIYGAVIGGIIIGVIETVAAGYISSTLKDMIAFIVLIAVMFYKPSGILKGKVLE